jgi:hypothetical protein
VADVSHRDNDGDLALLTGVLTGLGSPEGVVTANIGAIYRRRDGGTSTTLYVKESGDGLSTGWVAYGAASVADADIAALDARVDDLEAADTAQTTVNTNLNNAIVAETASRVAGDDALDTRLDAIEANGWVTNARLGTGAVTQTKIGDAEVTYAKISSFASGTIFGRCQSGIGPAENIYLGNSIELPTGSSQLLRRAALTGDVTAAADSNATTIANNAVTNAKLAQVSTATFKGRTTAGTGDPEDLTATQATALLNVVTTSAKGLVSTAPNNTDKFFRGDATWVAPVIPYHWGGAVMTAGTTDRFPNPVGSSTSPIGTTGRGYRMPFACELVATSYSVTTAHTTNTVTITPRVAGVEQTSHTVTVSAGTAYVHTVHGTPLALAVGDHVIPQMDHNGATDLAVLSVIYWIRPT